MLTFSLTGRIAKDAVEKQVSSKYVLEFSIPSTKKWKDAKGELQERTTWFKVTSWKDKSHGVLPYLTKGATVSVSGDVDAEAYIDKEGNPKANLVIKNPQIELHGSGEKSETPKEKVKQAEVTEGDDLPL